MNNNLYKIICDDWEVLYGTDGQKICEGHSIPWNKWFEVGQKNPNAELCTLYLPEDMQDKYDLWYFHQNFYDLPAKIRDLFSCEEV